MSSSSVLSRVVLASLVLAPVAGAQTVSEARAPGPPRDAGVYHVQSGTWIRGASAGANLGPDVIYRSDAPSGYFGTGWEGAEGVDEGILPGTTNPVTPGPQDSYRINGFTFEYCTSSAGPVTWSFRFYDSYFPCDDPDDPLHCLNEVGSLTLAALPSASQCWTVTIDLSGGSELCMVADGGPCAPGYDGAASGLDHFGWGLLWDAADNSLAGPMIEGYDPFWVPEGEGTCYDPGFTNPCGGQFATALGAQDFFGIGDPLNGCFFFGGYVHSNECGGRAVGLAAQFSMLLYTDCTEDCADECGESVFCAGPENVAGLAVDTCVCSAGSVNLTLTGAQPGQFAYLLVGAGNGIVTDPPGAIGTLCLAGAKIGRYSQDAGSTDGSGSLTTDVLNAASGGGGGAIPTVGGNLCSPPGQTWRFQYWHRDGMGPSGFSKGLAVTFE